VVAMSCLLRHQVPLLGHSEPERLDFDLDLNSSPLGGDFIVA
jgi:hypothetical protein